MIENKYNQNKAIKLQNFSVALYSVGKKSQYWSKSEKLQYTGRIDVHLIY